MGLTCESKNSKGLIATVSKAQIYIKKLKNYCHLKN